MNILFCKVGWCNYYNGNILDKPFRGGRYNETQIGHEIHNYVNCNGTYYGYVQSVGDTIKLERLGANSKDKFLNNVLVVWVSLSNIWGPVIVGWYKNATVYRKHQDVPFEAMQNRQLADHNFYNIRSNDVYLIPPKNRTFTVYGFGQSNVWYGDEETNNKVIEYIENYTNEYESRINYIDSYTTNLSGYEKEVITKIRINQDKFRNNLITKYGKCCLCGVTNPDLLIASHLKPWSKSDQKEKLDIGNGLLLCPNHDKLVDSGLVSFDDDGKILISNKLSETDKIFMNIRDDLKIEITEDNYPYIFYHRNNIFKK